VIDIRLQSPSSINAYKQCPRKYYYNYIEKMPTTPSIYLIRGKIVHSVLEDFFKIDIDNVSESNFVFELNVLINELFLSHWEKNKKNLECLDVNLEFYFNETRAMIGEWINDFVSKLFDKMEGMSFRESFNWLKPKTEVHYVSKEHNVQGYIDAVHDNGKVVLVDYKTSSRDYMSAEYKLQLAIYALLYKEEHGVVPDKVGVNFLKFGEKFIDVDEELLAMAVQECKWIRGRTQSTDIEDYPQKESPLCKWNSGQCDFYEICFR